MYLKQEKIALMKSFLLFIITSDQETQIEEFLRTHSPTTRK